jgi:hypothetical protein
MQVLPVLQPEAGDGGWPDECDRVAETPECLGSCAREVANDGASLV